MNNAWSSLAKEDEGSYFGPNCQTSLAIVLKELSLLFWQIITAAAFHWADKSRHIINGNLPEGSEGDLIGMACLRSMSFNVVFSATTTWPWLKIYNDRSKLNIL